MANNSGWEGERTARSVIIMEFDVMDFSPDRKLSRGIVDSSSRHD